jgi:hypothetical protein
MIDPPCGQWDRQAYVQPDGTLYPSWNRVSHNLIMNGPSGAHRERVSNLPGAHTAGRTKGCNDGSGRLRSRMAGNRDLGNLFPAVDNDDGSSYYWVASNVVAYGGFKNFLGNDKVRRVGAHTRRAPSACRRAALCLTVTVAVPTTRLTVAALAGVITLLRRCGVTTSSFIRTGARKGRATGRASWRGAVRTNCSKTTHA